MRKVFNMPRFLSSVAAAVLWCIFAAKPVMAQICYLPTGICEESSKPSSKTFGPSVYSCDQEQCPECSKKDSEEECNVAGYYKYDQGEGWNCSYNGCCDIWKCDVADCNKLGYTEGPTKSKDNWPTNRSKSDGWDCEPCLQGSDYYWNCKRPDCANSAAVYFDGCDPDAETFVMVPEYNYSGSTLCGRCEAKPCPSDTFTEEELSSQAGCFTVSEVKKIKEKKCYKLQYFDYITQEERDANYTIGSKSCYKFFEIRSANGKMCYKPSPIECPANQYVNKRIEAGKEVCECHRYDYNFEASETTIRLSAASASNPKKPDFKEITVISTRTSDEGMDTGVKTEEWEYEFPTDVDGISIEKDGNTLIINKNGLRNTSRTTDIEKTFDMVQTEANGATTRTITVTVIIEHDTCPQKKDGGVMKETQFESTCQQSGWLSKAKAKSVTGAKCYICYNDNCPAGNYTKYPSGSECPTDGNYTKAITDYGSTCCEALPDICPPGFTKGATPDPVSGYETTNTDFGSNCYKQKPDDCKAVNGGKNYIKGTAPSDGHTYVYGNNTEFGSRCYIDDTCPSNDYIKKGVGESCPTDGNYDSETTNYGSTCCKPKADDCVAANGGNTNYVKGTAPSGNGHTYKYGNKTAFGSNCYIDDTCPSGYTIKKGVGENCPANGNGKKYIKETTTYGSTCCMEISDKCPSDYPLMTCASGECKSTTTENGLTCYVDDKCPSGYSKTRPNGEYQTTTTAAGSTCYIDDNCPSNYPWKSCPTGKSCKSKAKATAFGTTCYVDDTCPNGYTNKGKGGSCDAAGTGCTNDIKSTTYGSTCCMKVCDSCPPNYSKTCSSGDCKSTTTTNGLVCYIDDKCPSGYAKGNCTVTDCKYTTTTAGTSCWISDTCPSEYPYKGSCPTGKTCKNKTGNTPYGSVCYALEDTCPTGYTKGATPQFSQDDTSTYTFQGVDYNYHGFATTTTASGSNCFKCGIGNPEHGYFGDCCKSDSDCKVSSHGPLHCSKGFRTSGDSSYGVCTECDKDNVNHCRWTTYQSDNDGWSGTKVAWTEYHLNKCKQWYNESKVGYANFIEYFAALGYTRYDQCPRDSKGRPDRCCMAYVASLDSSKKAEAQIYFDKRIAEGVKLAESEDYGIRGKYVEICIDVPSCQALKRKFSYKAMGHAIWACDVRGECTSDTSHQ